MSSPWTFKYLCHLSDPRHDDLENGIGERNAMYSGLSVAGLSFLGLGKKVETTCSILYLKHHFIVSCSS